METTFKTAVESYWRAKTLSRGTRNEYASTVRKWEHWGGSAPIEELQRKDIREFLDWVYERAVAREGSNGCRPRPVNVYAHKGPQSLSKIFYSNFTAALRPSLRGCRPRRRHRSAATARHTGKHRPILRLN